MKPYLILIFLFINIMLPSFFVSLHASDQDDEDLDSLRTTFVGIREKIHPLIQPIELDIFISDLPDEMISEVLTHLSIPNFQSSRQICQRWNTIVKKEHFLNRIFDFIQQNQGKRKKFFTQGNPYQISYCIFKDQNLILDLKGYPLFPRLQTIIYANPNFFPKFWEFSCSRVLKFNYPSELPYQTVDQWLVYGKILFLLDPLDTTQRQQMAFEKTREFIKNDPYGTARSKSLGLVKIFILSDINEDREMLRVACNELISEHLLKIRNNEAQSMKEWLAQVEIQWQIMDNFKAYVQAQFQDAAIAAATVTQAQPQ